MVETNSIYEQELDQEEKDFIDIYKGETDEQLCQRIRDKAEELGRPPRKKDMPGWLYLTRRLGPWPRALERAGLKDVGTTYARRQEKKRSRRNRRKNRSGSH